MREWNLGPGDPLELVISADFRLCTPDYINDQTWELVTAGGDPPALALRTTYGLRARSMRIFPRFSIGNQVISDPATFQTPPRLRRFYPNFLLLTFSPLQDIDVQAEYWVPGSHTCAGRFSLSNKTRAPLTIQLELCAQMVPLEAGHPMAPVPMQSVNVLAGEAGDLAPVIFLTGGPQPGEGPYPSLVTGRSLEAGETRTLVWAQAALGTAKDSMELARLTAAQPWEPARARIDLTNTAQSVELIPSDPDWEAALAFSQKTAFRLFLGPRGPLPRPSFVSSRQPNQGYSPRGDGSDYPPAWSVQSPLEAYFLAGLLPGAFIWAEGLMRNFLAGQTAEGMIPTRVGLGGQRGGGLAAPILASLAWRVYQHNRSLEFLRSVQPGLKAFAENWLSAEHDRDGDGFPEWDKPVQAGMEDNPAFSVWQSGGQGLEISAVETPALAALLSRELGCLASIAAELGQTTEAEKWLAQADRLGRLAESCWNVRRGGYLNRDRDSHLSLAGKRVGTRRGSGMLSLEKTFKEPRRLLVRLELGGPATRKPVVALAGRCGEAPESEAFERTDFQWGSHLAVATSRKLYTALETVTLEGVEKHDRISIWTADTVSEDVTQFLPLWAGTAEPRRVEALLSGSLSASGRFGDPYGMPACPESNFAGGRSASPEALAEVERIGRAVHLSWNTLIAEGLVRAGRREEAARLLDRLMKGILHNLKKQHSFSAAYQSLTGEGIGERNSLQGLAPVGLFLEILGVRIESPWRVVLSGKNPYPWPVTVKYRGLSLTRQADQTVVVFPDGQSLTLNDPTDAVVSIEP